MHCLWFLILVPLAGVVAWRLSGPTLKRISMWFGMLAALGLLGWFGYTAIAGTEFTETIFDRVMNAIGVIVGSVDIPLIQFLVATIVFMCWPRRWTYQPAASSEPAEAVQAESAESLHTELG